ncbi:hypothetical protein SK128_006312 [Halocaridina rubra]|uniref:Protein-lysine methyltransferase METTL21D n=1 Tax=Halocaridina rubra TaxID=373956 RepID=A0AAN8ZY22_HALRR
MFIREVEFEDIDKSLSIYQENEGDVGCVVWDAAIVLAKYLEKQRKNKCMITGFKVLELGSGTGFLGLAAALLGASQVTITDLQKFLPLMAMNIKKNKEVIDVEVEAKVLEWGNRDHIGAIQKPNVILVADCIYYEQSLEPLISTMRNMCEKNTVILMSYEERTTGDKPSVQNNFFEIMDRLVIKKLEGVMLMEENVGMCPSS